LKKNNILFLGSGNIAEAVISGLIKTDSSFKNRIYCADIKKERLSLLSKKYGIKTSTANTEFLKSSNIVFLSVKPQQIEDLLCEISGRLNKSQLVVSVAAGITTAFIEKYLGRIPVIRTMPNTPLFVSEGMVAICKGKYAGNNHQKTIQDIFKLLGKTILLKETRFDAVTAISGSGPAYLFYLAEAMQKAGIQLGFKEKEAGILAAQTLYGAGKLLINSTDSPAVLRQKVTSPGGTTEQAVKHFENRKLAEIIISAIKLAKQRSCELKR